VLAHEERMLCDVPARHAGYWLERVGTIPS
jgi:hypothetical protein